MDNTHGPRWYLGKMTALLMAIAALLVSLGLPLALGMVQRNRVYGYRTSATLADDSLWNVANRAAGRGLVGGGLAIACIASLVFADIIPAAPIVPLIALPVAVLPAIVLGGLAVQRAERKELKSRISCS